MPIPLKPGTRTCTIRKATLQDVAAIHALDTAVFGDIDGGYPSFFFGHMISIFPESFWVTTDLGGYCFVMLGAVTPWLYTIAVHPDCQSKGYGKQLMDYCETWLRKHRYSVLCLNVDVNNFRAIKFYENRGFYIIGERVDTDPIKLIMQKLL